MGLYFRDQEMMLKMSVLLNKRVPLQLAWFRLGYAQEQSKAHGTTQQLALQNASSACFEL